MNLLRLALVTWLATTFVSCSLLVDPENAEVRCVAQSGASDPCGELEAGLVCHSGKCERCEPGTVQEDCNLIDDDCDGRIDEGNDQDGDGFTWCGGGIRALADCVDTDATIRPNGDSLDGTPGHRDICGDGIDNDCSGVPDDAPDCDGTTECEDADTPCATSGACITCPVPQECQPCAADRNCGARRSICVAPLRPGSSCSGDADCESGVCVESAALGLTGNVGKICSRACCSDADCGNDNICLVRGNGTRLCVPPGLVGRVTKGDNEACERDDECASGKCDPVGQDGSSTCRRLCTTDLDCVGAAHGVSCIYQPTLGFIAPAGFVCGEATPEGIPLGGSCLPAPNRCDSGLCVATVAFIDGVCNDTCGATCNSGAGYVCSYETLAPSRLPLCVKTTGSATLGQSCSQSDECGEGRCVNGRCSQVCCNDDDCGGSHCRPISGEDGYGMYCTEAGLQ